MSDLTLPRPEECLPHPLAGGLPEAPTFRGRDGERWPVEALARLPWLRERLVSLGVSASTPERRLSAEATAAVEDRLSLVEEWLAFRDRLAAALDALDAHRRDGLRSAESCGLSAGVAEIHRLNALPEPADVEEADARAYARAIAEEEPRFFRIDAEALLVRSHDPAVVYGRAWLEALDATDPGRSRGSAFFRTVEDLRRSPRTRKALAGALRVSLPASPAESVVREAGLALAWLRSTYPTGAEISEALFRDAYVSAGSPGGLDRDGLTSGASLVPTLATLGAVVRAKRHGGRRRVLIPASAYYEPASKL